MELRMMAPGPAMLVIYWFIPFLIMATFSIVMMTALFSCCK
jgi:hypothetical protein